MNGSQNGAMQILLVGKSHSILPKWVHILRFNIQVRWKANSCGSEWSEFQARVAVPTSFISSVMTKVAARSMRTGLIHTRYGGSNILSRCGYGKNRRS